MNDVLALLAKDHDVLHTLLDRLTAPDVDRAPRVELVARLEERWIAHVDAEERVLCACDAAGGRSAAAAAHLRDRCAAVERILDRFGALSPDDHDWLPLLAVLRCQLEEHVAVEEAELFQTLAARFGAEAHRTLAHEYQIALREREAWLMEVNFGTSRLL